MPNHAYAKTAKKVIFSYLKMMCYSILTILLAIATAHFIGRLFVVSHNIISILSYVGYACWGTVLGSPGITLLTWNSGNSHAEILDQRLTACFSLLGIFVFVMSQALDVKV